MRSVCLPVVASLLFGTTALLSGCGDPGSVLSSGGIAPTSGNWQLASSAPAASQLPALSGAISVSGSVVTGLFHSDSTKSCAPPSTVGVVTGSSNADNVLSLSGAFDGGTLTITGTVAANGKSLTNATYNVTGGACGLSGPAPISAQNIGTVSGTYNGNFTDVYGNQIYVSTILSQSSPDANGNFVLSGSANLPASNGCFTTPTNTDSAQVTGQQFNISYADPNTGNSLITSGSVSTDGTILTVGSWTITGPCSGENGTGGTLTKQ